MKNFLVDQNQPFGLVRQERTGMGGPCDYGYSAKGLGDKTVRANHGATHAPSFANPNPRAQAQASVGKDNPFMFTGHPVKG